jgi:hypothetical protein
MPMRRSIALLLCVGVFQACNCSPGTPTPVTLRVKNSSNAAIWVDDSTNELGLEAQRSTGGTFQTFDETVACPCLACGTICNGCSCTPPQPPPQILRVDPGMSMERVWAGTEQIPSQANCAASAFNEPTCWTSHIPALNETLNLHLCYSPSAPGIGPVDAGVPVTGSLPPGNTLCVDKQFRVEDGVAEVGPLAGSACKTTSDCQNPGELCLNGQCTAACPANDIPAVGGSWQVNVPTPDDQGLLTQSTDGQGHTVQSGEGTLSAVRYSNGTMNMTLSGQVGGNTVVSTIYVTLPPAYAVPLNVGQIIVVRILDGSTSTNIGNRAITLRDQNNNLLLAADAAQLGAILSATDTAPFTVSKTQNLVACDAQDCGKVLHFTTLFDGGSVPVELQGGQAQTSLAGGSSYQLLNIADDVYSSGSSCALQSLMPYAILSQP